MEAPTLPHFPCTEIKMNTDFKIGKKKKLNKCFTSKWRTLTKKGNHPFFSAKTKRQHGGYKPQRSARSVQYLFSDITLHVFCNDVKILEKSSIFKWRLLTVTPSLHNPVNPPTHIINYASGLALLHNHFEDSWMV